MASGQTRGLSDRLFSRSTAAATSQHGCISVETHDGQCVRASSGGECTAGCVCVCECSTLLLCSRIEATYSLC